jgi:hypothetical protein
MRPGDFADGEGELDKAVTLLACRFRDDAYGMVAGLQTGNPALPASIGKLANVRFFGVNRNQNDFWNGNRIFEKSLENRRNQTPYIFYEGPPSANGMPGIHHVMARAIKVIFWRYKTLKGFYSSKSLYFLHHVIHIYFQNFYFLF